MKRVLVTGCGGNVGQYLAKYLCDEGYYVIGCYRHTKPKFRFNELIKIDLSQEKINVEDVDVIIHAAATIVGSTKELVADNINAVNNLLSFAEEKGVEQFVYLSTISAYGKTGGKLTINSDIINPSVYGMTKGVAENLVKESKIPECVVVGLPRMLGSFVDLKNPKGSGFLIMANQILHNEDVNCFIPEVKYNNFMHVEDLARFIKIIITNSNVGYRKILLGAEEELPMLDILRIMKESVQSQSEIRIGKASKEKPACAQISIQDAVEMGYKSMRVREILRKFMMEVQI